MSYIFKQTLYFNPRCTCTNGSMPPKDFPNIEANFRNHIAEEPCDVHVVIL